MLVENITIKKVGEVITGTSPTTGKTWSNRNILLAWEDETGESYINAVVDEEVWKQLNLHKDETASLTLRFRTRRFLNGFISNDIRIINPQN